MKVDLDEGFYDNRRRIARRATGEFERNPETGDMILVNGMPVPISEPMTIGDLFIEALTDLPEDEREAPKDKLRRARLSDLMLDGGHVELTATDVALIQKRAGKLTATAYLRIVEVLGDPDGESTPVDDTGDEHGAD